MSNQSYPNLVQVDNKPTEIMSKSCSSWPRHRKSSLSPDWVQADKKTSIMTRLRFTEINSESLTQTQAVKFPESCPNHVPPESPRCCSSPWCQNHRDNVWAETQLLQAIMTIVVDALGPRRSSAASLCSVHINIHRVCLFWPKWTEAASSCTEQIETGRKSNTGTCADSCWK